MTSTAMRVARLCFSCAMMREILDGSGVSHGSRMAGMSRILEWWRVTDAGRQRTGQAGVTAGFGIWFHPLPYSLFARAELREATTPMPEYRPGEPASATGLYHEVNVFGTPTGRTVRAER